MVDEDALQAWEALKISAEMACKREFSPFLCRDCGYYYIVRQNKIRIEKCLKEDIREWTYYRMTERR